MKNFYKHLCKQTVVLLGYKFLSMLNQKTSSRNTKRIRYYFTAAARIKNTHSSVISFQVENIISKLTTVDLHSLTSNTQKTGSEKPSQLLEVLIVF